MEFAESDRPHPELNVAPLIDVVFLLLIFFMLASTFIEPEAVDLVVPGSNAAAAAAPAADEPLTVQVTAQGAIRLNGLRLALNQLRAEVAARLEGDRRRPVTVRADAKVRVQLLVRVMDRIRAAGASNLRLATPEPG